MSMREGRSIVLARAGELTAYAKSPSEWWFVVALLMVKAIGLHLWVTITSFWSVEAGVDGA